MDGGPTAESHLRLQGGRATKATADGQECVLPIDESSVPFDMYNILGSKELIEDVRRVQSDQILQDESGAMTGPRQHSLVSHNLDARTRKAFGVSEWILASIANSVFGSEASVLTSLCRPVAGIGVTRSNGDPLPEPRARTLVR